MNSFRDSDFRRRHGPAIMALVWAVAGIVLVMVALQGRSVPGRSDLLQASGIVDSLHEDSRHVRHGPDIYTLRLRLRGADTEYVIDSGRLNGSGPYYRARRALQRGSDVVLWYEPHPDFGNRLWQIDQQGRRLMHYREVFDHETGEQMNAWLFLLGYLVASAIVVPLLVMWRRRIKARDAEPQQPAMEHVNN